MRSLALSAGALALAQTSNALRPFSRRRSLVSVPSFFAGWPVSELPRQTLALQSAFTLAAAGADLRRGSDWRRTVLGMSLLGASAIGLESLAAAARGSEEVLGAALRDGLDRGLRLTESDAPSAADAPAARRSGVVRVMRIRSRYAHDADIAYGPHGVANLLDVWRRRDVARATEPAPVLLQVPGGAWIAGNKQLQAYPLMSHLAERGWVCVPINYRLAPRSRWPAQIVDVKRAIAWVNGNIADYGGDPGFIAVTGGSAGGHLSALAALSAGDPGFQPGFEEADTAVQAAVPFYGAYDWVDDQRVGHHGLPGHLERLVVGRPLRDDRDLYEQASPGYRVFPGAPPFFLLHGTNDSLIPVEQGRAFAERLREVSGSPVLYAELPRAQHAFDLFGSVRAAATAVAVERFLDAVRRGQG